MKYIRLFENHSDYEDFASGGTMELPNVSYCETENEVHYNPIDNCQQYDYVDLGLPSGTKWATKNVGACDITDYGNYYMYGMGTKAYDSTDTPYAGTENPLALSADTAAQVLGGEWHTPTLTQFTELINNTTYQWVTDYQGSGINGGLFTSKNNINSVFFPAAGVIDGEGLKFESSRFYLWSSTPYNNKYCYYFYGYETNKGVNYVAPNNGFQIRAVAD